jgi:hypothetical protein
LIAPEFSMIRTRTLLASGAALACLSTSAAAQAPPFIPVQGSLYDDMGEPINAVLPVEFALYADDEGSTLIYGETTFVTFQGGFFNTFVGPVDLSRLTGPELFLGINVNGDGEMELIPIATVPFAAWSQRASTADTLAGLSVTQVYDGARDALGPIANDNPYAHNRYTDAEARNAMGTIANDNPYAHVRYSDNEARSAMGPISNDNPYHHNRYTDNEARAANNGRFASTTHEHLQEGCSWTGYGCGELVCPTNTFMAGMQARNNGNNEDCHGAGDYDEPSRRILCCRLGDPQN